MKKKNWEQMAFPSLERDLHKPARCSKVKTKETMKYTYWSNCKEKWGKQISLPRNLCTVYTIRPEVSHCSVLMQWRIHTFMIYGSWLRWSNESVKPNLPLDLEAHLVVNQTWMLLVQGQVFLYFQSHYQMADQNDLEKSLSKNRSSYPWRYL